MEENHKASALGAMPPLGVTAHELNWLDAVGSLPELPTAECTGHCRNTTSPPISTTTGSVSQGSDPLLPETTQVSRQCRCMKWTDEINIFIMWAYYRITRIKTDFTE
jgi:hypothetical protein